MTERQQQEQRTNEAFQRAVKGGGTPSEHQLERAKTLAAFQRAQGKKVASPLAKAKIKAELFGADWDQAVKRATPAERRAAAKTLAALLRNK